MAEWRHRAGRVAAALTLVAAPSLADAQSAPPPPAGASATPVGPDGTPPPALVGRLGAVAGAVSFHHPSDSGWVAATLNEPVSSGDAVFAAAGGHAELDAGTSLVALDGGSELDVATLDYATFSASAPQGRLFFALGALPANSTVSVATPRGTATLTGNGAYEIVAGDTTTPTVVTVVSGSAHLAAPDLSLDVAAGQSATVNGTDQLAGAVGPNAPPDPFLDAELKALAAFRAAPSNPAVAGMTGCQALAGVGRWSTRPDVGAVWYPPVSAGWVPYREGQWEWVPPYGWTWVDAEPWGFAPFHYGRWVDVDGSWAWAPGEPPPDEEGVPEPVYAPALVAWTDIGAGVLAGAALGALAAGAVGWIPLGPNEPYVPPYGFNRRYFDRVNRTNIRDTTIINNYDFHRPYGGRDFGGFANRRGATMASAEALRSGRPLGASARPFSNGAFNARPVAGRPVVGAPAGGFHRAAATGPSLTASAFHPHALPGGRLPFRPGTAGAAAIARPAGVGPAGREPGRPPSGGPVATGLPGLREHGAVLAGRPGAVPEARVGDARPDRAGGVHPGAVAAGAAAAAAVAGGAALAAHHFNQAGRAGEPARPAATPSAHGPGVGVERPAERAGVPGPAIRAEAPRAVPAAPHVAAPRPAEAPHPAPRPVAPAPRPAFHPVAPGPRPAFHPAAPSRPAFHPAPAPAPRPAPRPAPAPHGGGRPDHH